MLGTVLVGHITYIFLCFVFGNQALCFRVFWSFSALYFDFFIIAKSLISFRLSNIAFCEHCAPIVFAHDNNCSLLKLLVSLVVPSSYYFCHQGLIIYAIYQLSF